MDGWAQWFAGELLKGSATADDKFFITMPSFIKQIDSRFQAATKKSGLSDMRSHT
jgi:hypothetical protein